MMNYSLSKTTAVFVALFLVVSTLTSTTTSVSALSINVESESDECMDDPNFAWKNKRKDCDWIGSRNMPKKTRLCAKSKIKKNCRLTCGECSTTTIPENPDPIPIGTCPATKPEAGSKCAALADDSGPCSYDYALKGCTSGDLACTAGTEFKCEDGLWVESFLFQVQCIAPDDTNYNAPCDPKSGEATPPIYYATCPSTKPVDGTKCQTLAKDEPQCLYDYQWLGCGNVETLTCQAGTEYTCKEGVWTGFPTTVATLKCGISDPYGVGKYREACDPDDASASPVLSCPKTVPERDDPCGFPGDWPDTGCSYDHVVVGCPGDEELFCAPTTFAQCLEVFDFDSSSSIGNSNSNSIIVPSKAFPRYTWQIAMAGMAFCPDTPDHDWPAGDSCDPKTFDGEELLAIIARKSCPKTVPERDDPCGFPGDWPDTGCSYDHVVVGCPGDEELFCAPTTFAQCLEVFDFDSSSSIGNSNSNIVPSKAFPRYTWQIAMAGMAFCPDTPDDDWPAGDSCDPKTFDGEELLAIIAENKLLVIGNPGDKDKDPVIVDVDLTKNCPIKSPDANDPCGSPGEYPESGCSYGHVVIGCPGDEELFCASIATAHCEETVYSDNSPNKGVVKDGNGGYLETKAPPQYTWQIAMAGMAQCLNAPADWVAGDACDPDTFDSDELLAIIAENKSLVIGNPDDKDKDEQDGTIVGVDISENCPIEEPRYNEPCKSPGEYPESGCSYGHVVMGCPDGNLSCASIATAHCEESSGVDTGVDSGDSGYLRPGTKAQSQSQARASAPYTWQIAMMGAAQCLNAPVDWVAGSACDPETFDAEELLATYHAENNNNPAEKKKLILD